jgi:S-DNA-T family DNA segregation ATPase FtsK/SpoIIIE
LPLLKLGVVGILGPSDLRRDLLRALLVQVATHHPWDAIKIVVFGNMSDTDSLRWVRDLPQTWDDNGEPQFVVTDEAAIKRRLEWVSAQLEDKLRKYPMGARLMKPSFLLVFADPDLARGVEGDRSSVLLDLVFTQGTALGANALFLAERRNQLPSRCDDWVVLSGSQGRLLNVHSPDQSYVFTPDTLDAASVERFARAMTSLRQPLPVQEPAGSGVEAVATP